MNLSSTSLPLDAVPSTSPAVLLDSDLRLLSEHETKRAAEKALCEFKMNYPDGVAVMFRRIGEGWAQAE